MLKKERYEHGVLMIGSESARDSGRVRIRNGVSQLQLNNSSCAALKWCGDRTLQAGETDLKAAPTAPLMIAPESVTNCRKIAAKVFLSCSSRLSRDAELTLVVPASISLAPLVATDAKAGWSANAAATEFKTVRMKVALVSNVEERHGDSLCLLMRTLTSAGMAKMPSVL
jgi:hypothetical protein